MMMLPRVANQLSRLAVISLLFALAARPGWGDEGGAAPVERLDPMSLLLVMEEGDFSRARPTIEAAAAAGESQGLLWLGLMQAVGAGVPLDGAASVATLARAAEAGSRLAAVWLLQVTDETDARRDAWLAAVRRATPVRELLPSTLAALDVGGLVPNFDAARAWNLAEAEANNRASAWYALAQLERMRPAAGQAGPGRMQEYLHQAAEAGSAEAWGDLAMYASIGLFGVEEDAERAAHYRERAALAGHPVFQYIVGRDWLEGRGGRVVDVPRGWDLLERAAAQDEVDAINLLADRLRDGEGVPQDDRRALALYERGAALGDNESREDLAWMLQHGRGAERDLERAVKLYAEAAAAGSAWARTQWAGMLEEGEGVEADPERALALLRQAAEDGSATAMRKLGERYAEGRGVEADAEQAFEWFERAAQDGDAWSQNRVGWMLQRGEGVPADLEEAITWYELAAEKGNRTAMANLLRLSIGSAERAPDPLAALDWWRRLAGGEGRPPDVRLLFAVMNHPRSEAARVEEMVAALRTMVEDEQAPQRAQIAFLLAEVFRRGVPAVAADAALGERYGALVAALQGRNPDVMRAAAAAVRLAGDAASVAEARAELLRLAESGDVDAQAESVLLLTVGPEGLRDVVAARAAYRTLPAAARQRLEERLRRGEPARRPEPAIEADVQAKLAALGSRPDDAPPVPVYQTPPVYPLGLRFLEIEGEALIKFVVNEAGRVEKAEVVAADEVEFGPAAQAAVEQWRFAPGRKGGNTVPTDLQVPVVFRISNE